MSGLSVAAQGLGPFALMAGFGPNAKQRKIANAFSRNAQLLGQASTLERLRDAASERFDEPRVGQLVAHVAAKQAEFGRGVVDEFRAGRFSAAVSLVRGLLEMTAWIAWPICNPSEADQRQRVIRLVLQGYREAQHQGRELPPDARALLVQTTGKAARKPPSFPDMLRQLDNAEEEQGGRPFWVSHADHFDYATGHVHPSFHGPLFNLERPGPFELLGVDALVYGHQYLAISGATCSIIAELKALQRNFERRYASVAALQRQELDRLTSG